MIETWLTKTFKIKFPIIMAPMFLVSNEQMLIAAADSGIMGCIPALNYRKVEDFKQACLRIKEKSHGPFGVNLIVNKSNLHLKKQLQVCCEVKPAFVITSLGSPEAIIKMLSPLGIKVFCDVVDSKYAKKCEALGADALIAVNSGAGGHLGAIPSSILIPQLRRDCQIPIISAGGVGEGHGFLSMLALGAEGLSIGSPFIPTNEASVSYEYKKAVIDYGANDIVTTTKISGTPLTVINTPYLQKVGLEQNKIESLLSKNKAIKKYVKLFTAYKGIKAITKAASGESYKTLWCAGPSIEFSQELKSVKEVIQKLTSELDMAYNQILKLKK